MRLWTEYRMPQSVVGARLDCKGAGKEINGVSRVQHRT